MKKKYRISTGKVTSETLSLALAEAKTYKT